MRRTTLRLSVLALVLSACGGGGDSESTTPSATAPTASESSPSPSVALPTPTVSGTIAFSKVDDGWGDIYVIRTDGTGLKRLAAREDSEEQPAWSPDGGKIAFIAGTLHGIYSVRVMNADGSGQVTLTPGNDYYPTWSPDGTRIAFKRYPIGIHIVNADGSDLTRIFFGSAVRFPTWAPDGRIFFLMESRFYIPGLEGGKLAPSGVYSMEPDGSGLAPVVTRLGHVRAFSLSPDGRQLVIHDTANDRLALVPSSGQGTPVVLVEEVSQYAEMVVMSAWSPDGGAIAFASSSDHYPPGSGLFVVNADGSGLSVVPNTGPVWDPVWQPT